MSRSRQIEVNTIVRRDGQYVQVANILMQQKTTLTWDVDVKLNDDTIINWDVLRGEINEGQTEIVDLEGICQGQAHCDKCELQHMC